MSSPPTLLEPRIDAYGSKGRVAALLDFAELWALGGAPPSVAGLIDYIDDNGWLRRMSEHYEEIGIPEDPDDGEADFGTSREMAATRLTNLVGERKILLERRYPFEIEEGRLAYRGDGEEYLYLLAVTVAHAFSDLLDCPDPTDVFPRTVVRALSSRSLLTADVGACRAAGTGFASTVKAVADAIELRSTVHSGMVAVSANDEGVDVVAHFPWDADRPGTWVFLGQVTCAKSDRWEAKLDEVAGARWQRYLNLANSPYEFLAVPHHVDYGHLTYLCQKNRGVVLDRLRLAPWIGELSTEERAILDVVRGTPLADL